MWAVDCLFWIPWNGINFKYVPTPVRPYFAFLGNGIFVSFLSWYIHGTQHPDHQRARTAIVQDRSQVTIVGGDDGEKAGPVLHG